MVVRAKTVAVGQMRVTNHIVLVLAFADNR